MQRLEGWFRFAGIKIDSPTGLPAKSPVVVYRGQEYEMPLATVAVTLYSKSGHAYIPIKC